MCDPAILSAVSPVFGASQNRSATRRANNQQIQQIRQQGIENQNIATADQKRARLELQNSFESAERAKLIEDRQRLGEQQALEPLNDLQNFQETLDQNTQDQREVFASDLNESVEAGNQNIGSGLEGNVSEAFTSASDQAESNSLSRAATRGDQRARVSAVSGLLQDDARDVSEAGQNVNATNFAIQRQREIDEFFRQLGQNRADVQSRIAPAQVKTF